MPHAVESLHVVEYHEAMAKEREAKRRKVETAGDATGSVPKAE